MRFVVLDASVAVKWCVDETDSESAVALLDTEDVLFLAPDVFLAEVVNALLRQRRVGQLTDEALDKALRDLTFSVPELIPSIRLMDRAVVLARAWRILSMIAFILRWRNAGKRCSSPRTLSLSAAVEAGLQTTQSRAAFAS